MLKLIVGIDIGGTKVAGGLVTPKGRLVKSAIVPTQAAGGFKAVESTAVSDVGESRSWQI